MLRKEKILGMDVTNAKTDDILEYIFSIVKNSDKKSFIVTPNPEIVVYGVHHPDYRSKVNEASVALPDGIGILFAGMILGKPFQERIPGTDFMELICKESVRKRVSIGLLGGGSGVAEKSADCLRKKYPGVNIVMAAEEWPVSAEDPKQKANNYTQNVPLSPQFLTLNKKIDILFVAFGHPKQELWISANLDKLPVKVAMGVGGAFDYLSGNVDRAPRIIRKLGLEWFYRLTHQPWRWRRQLALGEFVILIVKEKISKMLFHSE